MLFLSTCYYNIANKFYAHQLLTKGTTSFISDLNVDIVEQGSSSDSTLGGKINTTRLVHYCVWPTALAREWPKGRSATAYLFQRSILRKKTCSKATVIDKAALVSDLFPRLHNFSDSSRFSCDFSANFRCHTSFLRSNK